jgi:hypothetical protein
MIACTALAKLAGVKEIAMNEVSIETLAVRLEQLERENRWWKVAVIFLGLFFVIGAVFGNKPKVVDEVRARRFFVVGVNDEITARLGPEGLTLNDAACKHNIDERTWRS